MQYHYFSRISRPNAIGTGKRPAQKHAAPRSLRKKSPREAGRAAKTAIRNEQSGAWVARGNQASRRLRRPVAGEHRSRPADQPRNSGSIACSERSTPGHSPICGNDGGSRPRSHIQTAKPCRSIIRRCGWTVRSIRISRTIVEEVITGQIVAGVDVVGTALVRHKERDKGQSPRPRGWARRRLQFVRQFVGIAGQRVDCAALQHNGIGVLEAGAVLTVGPSSPLTVTCCCSMGITRLKSRRLDSSAFSAISGMDGRARNFVDRALRFGAANFAPRYAGAPFSAGSPGYMVSATVVKERMLRFQSMSGANLRVRSSYRSIRPEGMS